MSRVLIVDDAKFMRVTIGNMLRDLRFDVVGEAENGKVAIEKYRQLKPDVVTMDITMPVMSGIHAVKAIISEFPDAKIVMITALGQQKMLKEALESGAKDFISKPFHPVQLEQVMLNITKEID
ncbi:MAG: response regulator [Paenisporosarcina sp.]